MKRFVIMMVLAIIATSTVVAQERGHAKFMGIEMGRDIYDFHIDLLKKGFEKTKIYENVWFYTGGKFSGKYVDLMVVHTSKDVVQAVAVTYETGSEYFMLLRTYNSLKEQLKSKYGNPIMEIEQDVKNKYLALQEIASGEREYKCSFNIPNGNVSLYIGAHNRYSGYVVLEYSDIKTVLSENQGNYNDL